jgi:hypothetical protein
LRRFRQFLGGFVTAALRTRIDRTSIHHAFQRLVDKAQHLRRDKPERQHFPRLSRQFFDFFLMDATSLPRRFGSRRIRRLVVASIQSPTGVAQPSPSRQFFGLAAAFAYVKV